MLADSRADPFALLNAEQRSAVLHGDDPLLVIAGAGSGKTLTLAARVAHLVLRGADPQRILLLTFSRRAAQEMQRRVGRMLHAALGFSSTQQPPTLHWAGTFHAIGARLLREYAAGVGLAPNFTIQDRSDSEDLMGLLRHELGLAATKNRFPLKGTCLTIYSRALNSRRALGELLREAYPWCADREDELKRLFTAYVDEKQRQRVLDYDDLLLHWSHMLDDASIARHVAARFDHVLVDEYQDTNRLQADILHALRPDGRGLTVVGDDAQAIYSFRAAEVRNILEFPARFEPPARVVTMERNYRSTRPILEASNGVIALAGQRFAKRLWSDAAASRKPSLLTVADESAQATWVADQVLRHREDGIALKGQAALFRTAHHSAALELELTRRAIPFVKFGGLKFLEAAHVKDVLSVLRWATNPRHRMAGLRVAQLVPGIGAAGARRLLDAVEPAADPLAALRAFRPPAAARTDWSALLETLAALAAAERGGNGWPAELQTVVDWYEPHLKRRHEDADVRAGDLAQLCRLAGGHASREAFLSELTLDPPDATSDEPGAPHRDEDYMILSTIHSAKGQEWKAVYVLNVIDGCIPSELSTGSADEIEEERRLLYVAMTRARHHLHLLAPQRFYVTQQGAYGDRHVYGGVSRFIPAALTACFETRPEVGSEGAGDEIAADASFASIAPIPSIAPPLTAPATLDLAARARAQWR